MFRSNFFAMIFAMYLGLIATLAIPSILKVLIHTKRSSCVKAAYVRYMQTIFHTFSWFRNDIKPDTDAWKSLKKVRGMHYRASVSASSANAGGISQRDMALTQFSYFGFSVLFQKELGIQCSSSQLEDFCHFWRILGHLHGMDEAYNICCDSMEETFERLQIIRQEFMLPYLTNTSDEFVEVSKLAVSALQSFDFIDFYEPIIFMLKRLIGVPGYCYLQVEVPENCDRNSLKYLELSYSDRFNLFMSVTSRQYLLKFFVFRWFYNILTHVNEFFVRHFPLIAMVRFGPRVAFVEI